MELSKRSLLAQKIGQLCNHFLPIILMIVLISNWELNKFSASCSDEPARKLKNGVSIDEAKSMNETNYKMISRPTRAVYLASYDAPRQLDRNEPYNNKTTFTGSGSQDQPTILEQCCACDESKYELVFEGLWSRYTHPDNFPENYWLAYFSDIIGASHSNEFRMWSPDMLASEGVRELAETGITKKLESELKMVSSKTRTIIKARELRYPALNSKTSAVFRTDRQHHLVSILSKLGPSPDWMVGVSALELCLPDCTWATQRVVNLHLWDAGTDSGTGFTAPDSPTKPQAPIHQILGAIQKNISNNNNSSNTNQAQYSDQYSNNLYSSMEQQLSSSPVTVFYNDHNQRNMQSDLSTIQQMQQQESMKPFARLTITRQRIYEKSCNGDSTPNSRNPSNDQLGSIRSSNIGSNYLPDQSTRPPYADCRFTEWSDWSSCSSTCGKGIRTRTRAFLDDHAHLAGCSRVDLIEKEICLSECIGNATCVTRDWSDWSKCSVDCGQGTRTRTRSPIGHIKQACQSIDLVDTEPCVGSCSQDIQDQESARCELTEWSQWSECSVACGRGTKIRTRQFMKQEDVGKCKVNLLQKQSCNGRFESCKGSTKVSSSSSPTQNNHRNSVLSNPNLPVIDCKLSDWSPWSTCSALCGNGKRTRSRYIIQMPQNGGRPCDKKLAKTQRCKNLPRCPPGYENYSQSGDQSNSGTFTTNDNNNHGGKERPHNGRGTNHTRTIPSTTTTTAPSSMMDDEDDSEKVVDSSQNCNYGNWTQWSECEVVCRPVQKGSNKVRQRLPLNMDVSVSICQVQEEFYYCDPKVYC